MYESLDFFTTQIGVSMSREEKRRRAKLLNGKIEASSVISSPLTYLEGSSSGTSSLRWVAQKMR